MIKKLSLYCFGFCMSLAACNTEEGAVLTDQKSFIKIIPGKNVDKPISVDQLSNGDIIIVTSSTEVQTSGNLSQIRIIRLSAGGEKLIDKYYPENLNESWEAKETLFIDDDNIIISANTPSGKIFLLKTNSKADSLSGSYIGSVAENLNYIGGSIYANNLVLLSSNLNSSEARIDLISTSGDAMSSVDTFSKNIPEAPTSNVVQIASQFNFGLKEWVISTSKNLPSSTNYTQLSEQESRNYSVQFLKETNAGELICFGEVTNTTTNNTILFSDVLDEKNGVNELNSSSIKHFLNQVKQDNEGGFLLSGGINTVLGDENNERADFLLIKTNANGKEIWLKTFGNPENRDILYDAVQATDGSIFTVGTTRFGGEDTLVLIKLDSQGNLLN